MRADKVVEQTISYIEGHIEEKLSLDRIAAKLHYSKFYIARTFAEETGCTIYRYIQGRRLTMAAEKLVKTQVPIVEIAHAAQYDSQQAFTHAFGRLYQCTPQAYRKNGIFYPKQPKMLHSITDVRSMTDVRSITGARTGCRKGGVMAA